MRSSLGLALQGLSMHPVKPKDSKNHKQRKLAEIVRLLTSDHDYDEMIDDPNNPYDLQMLCDESGTYIGLTAVQVIGIITRGYGIAYQNQPFLYRSGFVRYARNIAASDFWSFLGASDFDSNIRFDPSLANFVLSGLFKRLHAVKAFRSGCTACCHPEIDAQGWLLVLRKLKCSVESRWTFINWMWIFKMSIGTICATPNHFDQRVQRKPPRVGSRLEVMNSHLQSFASVLAAARMIQDDFTALECEMRKQLRGGVIGFWHHDCHTHWHREVTMKIIGLNFGACPEECKVWIADSLDEWSGEFWMRVEQDNDEEASPHHLQSVPGSWVSGDDTDDQDMMQISQGSVGSQVEIDEQDLWYFYQSRRRWRRLLRYWGPGVKRVIVLANREGVWEQDREDMVLDVYDPALDWGYKNRRRTDYAEARRAANKTVS